jgi:uncharacterized LabA/DUF88 family protein
MRRSRQVAGDSYSVPAAKQARREGIDFNLVPLWANITAGLQEHIDRLWTTCPNPPKKDLANPANNPAEDGGD